MSGRADNLGLLPFADYADHDPNRLPMDETTCRHCDRAIILDGDGRWIDPAATGDDTVWRETCDAHDTFTAEHEPDPEPAFYGLGDPMGRPCEGCNAEPGEKCRPGCLAGLT